MAEQLKAKLVMFKRWYNILSGRSNTAIKQGEGRFYSKDRIGGYYNDLTGKVNDETPLDEYGIPLTQISEIEFVHFPIAIFQYALGCYDCYIESRKEKYLDTLKIIANWGLEAQRADGSWDCFGPLKSSKYTVSSMGQAEGASVLLRAYTAFGEEKYLKAARKAIDLMLTDMKSGGTAFYDGDSLFLEEYPQTPRRSVMNGWIFSLFGLYDMSLADPSYRDIFLKSADTLRKTIDNYDNGYWSIYDLEKRIASPAYHELHIAQLNVMYDLTGFKEFKDKALRFSEYQKKQSNKTRAIAKKFMQKLTEKTEMVVMK